MVKIIILTCTTFFIGFIIGFVKGKSTIEDEFYLIPKNEELDFKNYELIQDLLRFTPERVIKQFQSRENFLLKMGEQAYGLKNIEFGEERNNG